MANKKISELESRASLSLSDLMAVGDPSTGYLYKTTISDLKTLTGAGVVSFNGRFGTVMPAEGDYTLTQLGDVIITSPTNGQVLKYNGSNWVNTTEVAEADTLDTVTGRGNTTANSISVGSVTAAGLSNLMGQIRTFATTGNTYIGANPAVATDAGFKLDILGTVRVQNRLNVSADIYFPNNSTDGIVITGNNVVYPKIIVGSENTVSGNTNLILGKANTSTGNGYVFGTSNTANSNGSMIFGAGNQANTSGQYTILIGGNNTTSHGITTFTGTWAIGSNNVLAHQASAIMGSNQTTTANNQLIFASSQSNVNNAGYNDIYFGTGVRSVNTNKLGSNIVINGSGAGADVDKSGGNVTIAGGKGTGAGTPGDVIISTASTTTSGSTLQSLTERMRISNTTGNLTVVSLAGTGSRMVIADATGVLSTQAIPSTSGFVTLDTAQTITGDKIFSTAISAVGGISLRDTVGGSNYGGIVANSSYFQISAQGGSAILIKASDGTNALTIGTTGNTAMTNVTATSFIKSGGTSSQFLKADGSVDSSTYATTSSLSSYLPLSGGTLTGALNGTSASFSSTVTATTGTTGAAIKLGGFTNYGTIQDANDVRRIWFENTGSFRTLFDLPASGTNFSFRHNDGTVLLSLASTGAATFSSTIQTTHIGINATPNTNAARLFVAGTSSLYDSAGTRGITFFLSSSGVHKITSDYIGTSYYPISLSARDNTGDLYLTTDGKIGIGSTNPGYQFTTTGRFEIANGVTGKVGTFGQSTATTDTYITIQNTAGNFDMGTAPSGHYLYGQGTLPMQFFTNFTERMRISSAGNVGINTTNPTYTLQVSGTGYFNSSLTVNSDINMVANNSYLKINRSGTATDGVVIFQTANVNKWILGARGENTNNFYLYSYGTSNHPLVIDYSTGAATFSGDVKVKTLEVTNVGTDATSSGVSTYMRITVNGQNYLIPLHGTP